MENHNVGGAASGDPSISIAFALGWETASLFRGGSFNSGRSEVGNNGDLPGLSALNADQRIELATDLIAAYLKKLEDADKLSVTSGVDTTLVEALRAAATAGGRTDLGKAVRELHLKILFTLTAAELRLGRAYGLGHALSDTCLLPTDRDSFDVAFGTRLVSVKDWLADLASGFPEHSSRAVVLSLRAWESWAADPTLDGKPLDWNTHGAGVRDALHRQGELWRDLLAYDKHGQDMLETRHYLKAANSLVGKMASTLWHFLKPLRFPLLVSVPLLVGGVALLLLSSTKALGLVLAAAGALGITGAGIRTRLGKIATQLQDRLWGAELDLAIAEAVLLGPPGWGARVADTPVPTTGAEPTVAPNIETLTRFRQAIGDGKRKRIRQLITANAKFIVDEQVHYGRDAIIEWLLEAPEESAQVTAEPSDLTAVGPGLIVASFQQGASVWRVQEGKIRRWQSFANKEAAFKAAQSMEPSLPPDQR